VRRTGIRFADLLGVALLAVISVARAQDTSQQPKVPTAEQVPGSQLIVWTETQRPHPIPETSTEMYAAASDQAHVLNGMILARGSDLFLAVAHHAAFRIENNKEQIRVLAGKHVRIYGKVESGAGLVYVLSIAQL
jgi:CHASE1-domain containing sensor protein